MDGISSTPQSPKQRVGIILVGIIILVLLIPILLTLNYLNILPLSSLFPNQLGWLPHKPYEQQLQQTNGPTTAPVSDSKTKEALTNFLPTILAPSLLPSSNSDIKLESYKEGFSASWVTKEGVAGVNFDMSSDSNKISSLEFRYQKIQLASPSVELAQSTAPKLFNLEPKGTWTCTQVSSRRSYCENFWEEQDVKRGLGFQIDSLSSESARLIFSLCEHTKESKYYSSKSCRADFTQTGVQ